MICECDTKIMVYKIIPIKLRKFTVFKIVEKFKFDKMQCGLMFGETLHTVRMVQIGDTENVYLVTKGQGEMILLTEKNLDQSATTQTVTIAKFIGKNTVVGDNMPA